MERDSARTPASSALPVAVEQLSKSYGSVVAIDDISLSVERGEFVTLLGPSGSGKTTLLMMIAGFARPTAGSIRIGETEIVRLPPHKRDVGMVFQSYALFPHMNVGENIAYPLKLRGVDRETRRRRVAHALEMIQLAGYESRRVDQLSGGQRQRVALARAIVFEPRILLMDEPLSALDKKLREAMQIEIRHLHERLGMTTVYVTHDQREALTMSDRVAVIHQGRFAQIDKPAHALRAPGQPLRRRLHRRILLPAGRGGTRRSALCRPAAAAWPSRPPAAASANCWCGPEKLVCCARASPWSRGLNRFEGKR